ncbi:MAG: PAS domain S-box protein [Bacteroidota bacterium]
MSNKQFAAVRRKQGSKKKDGTCLPILDGLIKDLGDGVVTFDGCGRVTSWNRGAEKIYGYKAREVLGKSLRMTIPKRDLKKWREGLRRVLSNGEVIRDVEFQGIKRDGTRIWLAATFSPIHGDKGEITGAASMIRDITHERGLREQLEHSERMYHGLFETSRDIVFITSVDGTFIDVNQAGVEAFGFEDKSEMMGVNIPGMLYVDPEDRKRFRKKIARNGYAMDYELRLKKKNGEIMDVVETSTPIRNERGEIIAYRGILRDVTERKALERKLKESEEKYRSLIDASPDGAAVTCKGKFLYTNRAFARLYGYQKDTDLLNKSIFEIVSEEQREDVLHWFQQHELDQRTPSRYEFTGMQSDKKKMNVEVYGSPVLYEGKACLLTFHRDITERRLLHEELGEAERIVSDILATMGDALVITDLHGKVLQVNREFERTTGYSRREAFGMEFPYPWLLEEEMSRFVLWISELRTKSFLHDFDMNWVTKGKKRIAVSLNTTLLQNTRGEPIAMLNIARDISERKHLAEELEARSRQIEHLYQETLAKSLEIERRNKELDDFTYVVSHDLKEPLVTIEGYGKILQSDFQKELGSTGVDYLKSMINSANRMKIFIDDLLALTRLSRVTESFQPIQIGKLIEEVKSDLEFRLREKNVYLVIQEPMPTITCNESQLKLVFRNLISNAIKFNDKPVPKIVIGYVDEPRDHRFFVQDNGIGIEPQYFEKIFGIFQRLHRSEDYGGTGVGLTIVQKIIDLHQGRIWVESKAGEGATFFFTLPK